MATVEFVRRLRGIKYTGSNSEEILTALGYMQYDDTQIFPVKVSETGGVLTLRLTTPSDIFEIPVSINEWIQIPNAPGWLWGFNLLGTNANVTAEYVPVSTLVNP